MEMNNKTSPKIFFFGKDSKKSFYQYLEVKILKNIRVDVHEEKNDAESDIENILVGPDYWFLFLQEFQRWIKTLVLLPT